MTNRSEISPVTGPVLHPWAEGPKVLIWDIETTNLRATFGTILAIGWKWLGHKKTHVWTIIDPKSRASSNLDDKGLVEAFSEVFNQADYHVTWYGKKFDQKMVQAKLIRYGLPPLKPCVHIDLWETARRHFNLHSNRLAVWQQYLGVEHEKTQIDFDAWLAAAYGDKKAIQEVKHHCQLDVMVLEEVFLKMRPWIGEEPARRLIRQHEHRMACTKCGSLNTTKKGTKVTRTRRYQQWQCQDCGSWMRGRLAEKTPSLDLISNVS